MEAEEDLSTEEGDGVAVIERPPHACKNAPISGDDSRKVCDDLCACLCSMSLCAGLDAHIVI